MVSVKVMDYDLLLLDDMIDRYEKKVIVIFSLWIFFKNWWEIILGGNLFMIVL